MKKPSVMIVKVVTRAHGKDYFADVEISLLSSPSLNVDSWLRQACKNLAESSRQERIRRSVLYNIQSVLNILLLKKNDLSILNIKPEMLVPSNIVSTLANADKGLLAKSNAASTRKKSYYDFQKFIFDYLEQKILGKLLNRQTVRYKAGIARLAEKSRSTLNSSQITNDKDGNTYPIDATPHENYKELIETSRVKLITDLKKLSDSAIADISIGDKIRKFIIMNLKRNIDDSILNIISRFLFKKSMTSKDIMNTKHISNENLLTAYLNLTQKHNLLSCQAPHFFRKILSSKFDYLSTPDWPPLSSIQLLGMHRRLCNIELQAIFILMLCRTGWNNEALSNLTTDKIIMLENGDYVIQAYKSKTDDETPPTFIDKREYEIINALRLLKWNRLNLIQLKYIYKTEKRLWFGWTVGHEPYKHQLVTLRLIPYNFIKRHNLFKFSPDQIRTHKTNLDFYNSLSIETTRRFNGHARIGTSGRYLNNYLNQKINSSIMLDFQKKLETKILWNIGHKLDLKNGTINLIPIGDGSLCKNPKAPPEWINIDKDGLCSGLQCNQNGGCPNRTIIIDKNRIEEVVRKNNYYRNNWKRLYAENKEKFELIIAPNIIFNAALHNYIKNSAHGHILKKIEKALSI